VTAPEDVQGSPRPAGSRLLHVIDRVSGRPAVAVAVVGADLAWVLYSSLVSFPARLESVFQTLVAALTLAMVFVIQHTQSRQQIATQRKLDEILSALPRADNALIALEEASDATIASARSRHLDQRRDALQDPAD
jgi:low affinity Fe/Cu permease